MRFITFLAVSLALMNASGCGSRNYRQAHESSTASAPLTQSARDTTSKQELTKDFSSLKQVEAARAATQAADRKIIRNANLALEVASPAETQSKIATIAESHHGFVVDTEATQRTDQDRTKPETTVTLVVRVPVAQFNQTVTEIRAVGLRVVQEKMTGQDVTEEFMDLEARVKNQKALEAQFIEIMKRAGKVEDALNVQRELANVRTEIERLEGRRRFLENQSSLSTINVTLQTPTQIVNATGFWYKVKSAFADGVDAAAEVILFLIRAFVALLPIVLLIILPAALIAKLVFGRLRRKRVPRENIDEAPTTS
ncbi:MAG TPA: DUF4349 domain-containing protein [Pyrinomonadaceae bacterium]|nr:DUF4349 domain-containing protein [Pyrinomonadaceae bacterium]